MCSHLFLWGRVSRAAYLLSVGDKAIALWTPTASRNWLLCELSSVSGYTLLHILAG